VPLVTAAPVPDASFVHRAGGVLGMTILVLVVAAAALGSLRLVVVHRRRKRQRREAAARDRVA
jgi:hypothetical protein